MAVSSPPRFALWLIEHALPVCDRDVVVGDVIEDFGRLAAADPAAARRWCRRQALRSLVPGLRRRLTPASVSASSSKGRFSMRGFTRDLVFGIRLLRHHPLMAIAGVLSLAVGLGLNVLLFTLANAILFRTLPLQGADRLVMLQQVRTDGVARDFSYPAYVHFRDAAADVFDTTVAYSSASATVRLPGGAEPMAGEYVSGNLFPDLVVPMAMGRGLAPNDDRPDAPPAVVVSYAYWQRVFGSAKLTDQTLVLNRTPFTVVGVTAPDYFGMEIGRGVKFWVPIGQMFTLEQEDYRARPTVSWLALMGRLKPGVSREAAAARLAPASKSFYEALRFPPQGLDLAEGSQGDSDLPRNMSRSFKLLLAASLFVLLIACVNVANLQLARASARGHELAVRAALGAGRARLVSLLIADALILTVPAGVVALAFAALARNPAAALIARYGEPITLALPIDMRVFGAAIGMTVLSSLIVGGISAFLSTRRVPSLALAAGGRAGIGGAARTQRALVIVQFALSMTLAAGAALLLRTVSELRNTNMGFSRDIALIDVALGPAGYTRETMPGYYSRAFERIKEVPGVEGVALAHVMPLDFGGSRQTIYIAGYTPAEGEDMELNTVRVSPGYFDVMRIPVIAGREFDSVKDAGAQPRRVIVNETMARRFWPNGDAVGRMVRFPGPRPAGATGPPPFDVEVIGVVADVHYRMVREKPRPTFYVSTSQQPISFFVMHVRTKGNPEPRLNEIARAAASVDPGVPVARAVTLQGQLDRNISDERMARSIAMALGIAALVLAATGLYATMAFAVRRRTREIGVRMALGARTSDVRTMVVRQGLVLAAVGVAFGVAGAMWAGWTLQSQLYGVSPADGASLIGAAMVLTASAVVASWLPARRATLVDPIVVLREQ